MTQVAHNKGRHQTICKRGHPQEGDNLYVSPKGVRMCKACMRVNHSAYRKTLKGKIAGKARDLREAGWTQERYDTVRQTQDNSCAICRVPFGTPYCDHDHELNTPRGLLCNPCNAGLGMFKDNSALLELAAIYLREYGK